MRKIWPERSSRVFDSITSSTSRVADLDIEEMKGLFRNTPAPNSVELKWRSGAERSSFWWSCHSAASHSSAERSGVAGAVRCRTGTKLWEMPRLKAGRGGAVFGGRYSSSFNSYSCKSCCFQILMKMKGILGCPFIKKQFLTRCTILKSPNQRVNRMYT